MKLPKFAIPLTTIVVFLLVVAAGITIFTSQKLSPNPSPTLTSTLETSGWRTYRNEDYGFETKYYPDLAPTEYFGTETTGQFAYLLLVRFGINPTKFTYSYELRVSKQQHLADHRTEIIGHITDKIDSEEEIVVNGNRWTKINYQIFVTTDYVPATRAIINRGDYNYSITAMTTYIDQVLSTFKFLGSESPTPQATPATSNGCQIGGCGGELCGEEGERLFSTCEVKPEAICYKTAVCERQADGKCGWTMTPKLEKCLAEKIQSF